MGSARYVALLRGINVGGRNQVAMAELRSAFEDAGHTGVSTFIQSGNVLFRSSTPRGSLEADVEHMLERRLGFPIVVVVRAWPGRGVVYFERLSAERTKSRMSRIVGTPEYASMTIRSWATTTKLLALLDDS